MLIRRKSGGVMCMKGKDKSVLKENEKEQQ